jgi:D-lyxose ketol-isomerase
MNQDIVITSYEGEGYRPMIDFDGWRVAILNYCEELEVGNLKTMQKHCETDEVFVLLEGNCTLFLGGAGENVEQVNAIRMEPGKQYNVKKGVWHTHTLTRKSMVLIVENRNTCDDNSPTTELNREQVERIQTLYCNT